MEKIYTPINNKALINLISVSVVAAFCYYYVGSSKDLLENLCSSAPRINFITHADLSEELSSSENTSAYRKQSNGNYCVS